MFILYIYPAYLPNTSRQHAETLNTNRIALPPSTAIDDAADDDGLTFRHLVTHE